jgi:hypothetical protein
MRSSRLSSPVVFSLLLLSVWLLVLYVHRLSGRCPFPSHPTRRRRHGRDERSEHAPITRCRPTQFHRVHIDAIVTRQRVRDNTHSVTRSYERYVRHQRDDRQCTSMQCRPAAARRSICRSPGLFVSAALGGGSFHSYPLLLRHRVPS